MVVVAVLISMRCEGVDVYCCNTEIGFRSSQSMRLETRTMFAYFSSPSSMFVFITGNWILNNNL